MAKGIIYTLGTSNRTLDEFFSVLNAYGIEKVLDVRRYPTSRRFPHFSKKSFSEECLARGIAYVWLGELLGGFRPKGYHEHRKKEAYLKGIEKVEEIAGQAVCVLVCAERLPWKCHRLALSQDLMARGWGIVHIIEQGKVWNP